MASVSDGNVTVSSLAGATFTAVNYFPAQTLNSTYLAYSRTVAGVSEVYKVPYTGGAEQLLTHSVEGCSEPAASRTGHIYYNEEIGIDFFVMRADGSDPYQLSLTGPVYSLYPSVSADGTKIAVDGGGAELWRASSSGGTGTLVQSNDSGEGTTWSPSGSYIGYVAINGSGYNNIYTTAYTGGTASDVTPDALVNSGNWSQPSWSADGLSMAASFVPSGGSRSEAVVFATNTSSYIDITPSTYSDSAVTFSPDGTKVAFYRSSTGGATPGIYIADYSGSDQYLLLPDGSGTTGAVSSISWSPFPESQKVFGSSGAYWSSNVDGFLCSESGSQFASSLGFTTTTPSTAAISSPAVGEGGPLVFTLSGDNITGIDYTNGYFSYPTTLITPTTTTPSALVTIDGQTGLVDLVATAMAVPKPATAQGNLVYSGKFSAIFDSNGKNLTPSGASQVVVNPKTGHLVSFK